MMQQYPILFRNNAIGTASAARQGLYYRFECRCKVNSGEKIRVHVKGIHGEVDLGICVPMGDDFGLVTRIPIKRIGEGTLSFYIPDEKSEIHEKEIHVTQEPETEVSQPTQKADEKFVPISDQKPVDCLTQLLDARLEERNEEIGLVLTEPAPAPQDSDPSQESPSI